MAVEIEDDMLTKTPGMHMAIRRRQRASHNEGASIIGVMEVAATLEKLE